MDKDHWLCHTSPRYRWTLGAHTMAGRHKSVLLGVIGLAPGVCLVLNQHADSMALAGGYSQELAYPFVHFVRVCLCVCVYVCVCANARVLYVQAAFKNHHLFISQGSIFFPLPNGYGVLHNLIGSADPPKPIGSINQDIPCKTAHTEPLTVHNWLRKPQRFRAFIEMIRPEKPDRSVTFTGPEFIDVPALGKKDFKLSFFSYKEGNFIAKVCAMPEGLG